MSTDAPRAQHVTPKSSPKSGRIARVVLLILLGLWVTSYAKLCYFPARQAAKVEKKKNDDKLEADVQQRLQNSPEERDKALYPRSGEGLATATEPLKVYMDPQRTYYRPSKPARYTFEQDPSISWDDTEGYKVESNSTEHHKEWLAMPAGHYLVRPIKDDEKMYFKWWTR